MISAAALDQHPAVAIGAMTTAALAKVLGKDNARAARDWCKRHGVPYCRDGKYNWVRIDDVRRALDVLGSDRVHADAMIDAVDSSVARMIAKRRR